MAKIFGRKKHIRKYDRKKNIICRDRFFQLLYFKTISELRIGTGFIELPIIIVFVFLELSV